MELTTKFKKAVAMGKSYMQNTTDKAMGNQQLKSLTDKSVGWYTSVVTSARNMVDTINKELNTPVYETESETTTAKELPVMPAMPKTKDLTSTKHNEVTNVHKAVENSVVRISERQRKIVKYIDKVEKQRSQISSAASILSGKYKEVNVTAQLLAKKFKVHPRTVQRDLSLLLEMNIIRRIGPDKGGYWEINY